MYGSSCSYTYNEGKERMIMPDITKEAYEHFERVIYNPLLIIVLEKDIDSMRHLPFKFGNIYVNLLKRALKQMKRDLKESSIYLVRHNMRLVRDKPGLESTKYTLISMGYEEHLTYANSEIKKKSEDIMSAYLIANNMGEN